MPDSSSKSGSPRQPSSRPPFRRDWPGIRFSSWNAGFQLEKRIRKTTFITAPFQEGLAGDPLFELECRIPARKADPQDNLHHGPLSGGIGRGSAFRAGTPDSSSKSGSPRQPSSRPPFRRDWPGSAFRAGMPDSSSKSGSPRQPSSRPPFRRDWPGIRFSSWNAGFQDNLHHGPLSGGIGRGSAFRAGMPDSSSKSGSPRQPSSRPPFRRDWPGIRFSSWNTGFLHHSPLSGGIGRGSAFRAGMPDNSSKSGSPRQPSSRPFRRGSAFRIGRGSAFRAGMPDSSLKSGSPRQPSSRPPFRRDWPGIRFSSWNAGFQLEKRIPKTTFITAPFQEGLAGDPLFELECRIPARKADPQDNLHHGPLSGGDPLFGLAGDPLFELECRIPARKADPQHNLHHGPLSGGIGRGSAFRAGMPDSSSKSGSPRQPSSRPPFRRDWPGIRFSSWNAGFQLEKRIPTQPSSRPPFRRDWPGIRFSSWNAGFQLEKRIPKTTFITASFQEGIRFSDWPGIRFSSWNAGFQLEKRIPKTTFITAPFQEGLAGDPLFELECRIPA